jgi:hypothetical protein
MAMTLLYFTVLGLYEDAAGWQARKREKKKKKMKKMIPTISMDMHGIFWVAMQLLQLFRGLVTNRWLRCQTKPTACPTTTYSRGVIRWRLAQRLDKRRSACISLITGITLTSRCPVTGDSPRDVIHSGASVMYLA